MPFFDLGQLRPSIEAHRVAEVGSFGRFENPKQRMAFLGLVPTEHSSGGERRQGAITKAGNAHVRRILAEAAWAYHVRPGVGRGLLARQEGQPKKLCDIAWRAQVRLCGKYRRMVERKKAKSKVATAVARELVGFVWDIGRQAEARSG